MKKCYKTTFAYFADRLGWRFPSSDGRRIHSDDCLNTPLQVKKIIGFNWV